MDIINALNIMEIDNLGDVNKEILTKNFRRLMRKHHPDLYHNNVELLKINEEKAKNINEAHEVLEAFLKQLEAIRKLESLNKKEEIFAVIPFKRLFELYSGQHIRLGYDTNTFELSKSNLRVHRIILLLECSILHQGITYSFSNLRPAIISDEYSIECILPVIDTNDIPITVNAYDKSVNLILRNNETRLKLKYSNSVSITINIRKKLITENN